MRPGAPTPDTWLPGHDVSNSRSRGSIREGRIFLPMMTGVFDERRERLPCCFLGPMYGPRRGRVLVGHLPRGVSFDEPALGGRPKLNRLSAGVLANRRVGSLRPSPGTIVGVSRKRRPAEGETGCRPFLSAATSNSLQAFQNAGTAVSRRRAALEFGDAKRNVTSAPFWASSQIVAPGDGDNCVTFDLYVL